MDELIALAVRGLSRMHRGGIFAHTLRSVETSAGKSVRLEGENLRYSAIVALGTACIEEREQRSTLHGFTAADLARNKAAAAKTSDDPGAIALAAWAAAEVAGEFVPVLFERLGAQLRWGGPIATVDCSWTLAAALAARRIGNTEELARMASERLLSGQGPSGLFPHMLPASASGRLRAHVGCFADQVYPIQALARWSMAHSDQAALEAAGRCAARICELQGSSGQWWWHYHVRDGSVVEGYPVYSVHQHAMAPMALLELREAGGRDFLQAVSAGAGWLFRHPEVNDPLVFPAQNVIWRKAGRREPRKLVRAVSAATTAIRPGLRVPGLNVMFPPSRIDFECRPYELGWLLYAWLSEGMVGPGPHGIG